MVERLKKLPPPTAPLAVARIFAVEECSSLGALTLRYWRGGWWAWNAGAWREESKDVIRARLYNFTDAAVYERDDETISWLPNIRRVNDLLDALKVVCETPASVAAPCWLVHRKTGTIVACENGLLDLKTRTLIEHTPHYFNTSVLPFAFDPDATSPVWDQFMLDLWGDDEEPPNALEEVIGCAVAGKLDQQRILVLVGPPRAGKSLITAVFSALLGDDNVAWPRLVGLTDDKTLSSLIGKSACIIADMRATSGKTPEIAEVLLMLSGQDRFTIDRKYKEAWTGALPVQVVIVSNEMPTLRDASGALPARYLPLLLTETWLGREDRSLRQRLLGELPGILNHALDGLAAVEKTGRLTVPQSSEEAMLELSDMANPMSVFAAERLEVMPRNGDRSDYIVTVDELLTQYNEWAVKEREEPITKPMLGKRLRAALPLVKRSQPQGADGARTTAYTGVRLVPGKGKRFKEADAALAELQRRTGGRAAVFDGAHQGRRK